MHARLRNLAFALAALAAACGPKQEAAAPPAAAPSAAAPSQAASGVKGLDWVAAREGQVPDWINIAHQAGGGDVDYNAKSVLRDTATGITDVWVQITYRAPQTYQDEDATTTRQITYNKERVLFRYDCAKATFAIVERRIMGAGEAIEETIKTPPKPADFRATQDGGVSALVYGPTCRPS
ncbi:MAG: hypothetical protein AB7M12_07615 [Hyphomonadaceae bacterium]